MPRAGSNESRECTGCSKSGGSVSLLECLACLRDGREQEGHAYCQGDCFQRHWRSHRDRKLGGKLTSSARLDDSMDNKYALHTLRATSQPFLPGNPNKTPVQQRQRMPVASRMIQLANQMPQPLGYLPYAQTNGQPILATGPHHQRR